MTRDPSREKPHGGVDLDAARTKLAGLPARRLDVDWIVVDEAGQLAVLLGDDTSPIPSRDDPKDIETRLEIIARTVAMRAPAGAAASAYRAADRPGDEPIWDPPAEHELPFDGYPHLVFAAPEDTTRVRQAMLDLGGRELVAHDGFAVAIDGLGAFTYEELHDAGACLGCRVMEDPSDPRPRSAEVLARAGLYVYAFGAGRLWLRVASPSVATDESKFTALAPIAGKLSDSVFASRIRERFTFDRARPRRGLLDASAMTSRDAFKKAHARG